MERNIKTIGVLTSGGDAPGMNAAIRAVTRTARYHNMNVIGVMRGYQGLIEKEFIKFTSSSVSNTIQRGGTILKTARCHEFLTEEGRRKAYENMVAAKIDALVVIGGNGSLTGAQLFAREYDIPIIGLPGTIDNDLYGTDSTIGYDSALNTIVECVDKIRDTANSHDRIFFVEVMGRDAGFLAQNSAIASGAEAAIIPEGKTDVDQLAEFIERGKRKSKNSAIVLVSESQKDGHGGAFYYAERVKKEYPELVASKKGEDYYLKMMIAWYFATALAKQYAETVPYFENRRLDEWTHRKAIQKAVESYRVTDEHKEYLKSLR